MAKREHGLADWPIRISMRMANRWRMSSDALLHVHLYFTFRRLAARNMSKKSPDQGFKVHIHLTCNLQCPAL